MAVPAGPEAAVILGFRAAGWLVRQRRHLSRARGPFDRKAASGLPVMRRPGAGHRQHPGDLVAPVAGPLPSCGNTISPRYPMVEGLIGLLFAAIGLRFGISWTGVAQAVLAAGLVVLAFIDLDHMLLPRKIVYVTLTLVAVALGGGAASGSQWHRLA